MSSVQIAIIALILSLIPSIIIVIQCVERYKMKMFLERIKPGTELGWVNTLYHRGSPFDEYYDKKYIGSIIVTDIKSNDCGDVYVEYKHKDSNTLHSSSLRFIYSCYDIIE